MDAYSGYNQILRHPCDEKKMAFITSMVNCYYKAMPFGLKNVRATYQRLINKVFTIHIGNIMEIYINEMLVKTTEEATSSLTLRPFLVAYVNTI